MKIDNLDREIIKFIQGDIPVESRPFLSLAQKLNVSENEIIIRVIELQKRGIIRRFAAILRHYRAGFTVNAMVVWKVNTGDADLAGNIMTQYNQISHCYLRDVPEEFGYNLFCMIHANSEDSLAKLIKEISERTGIKDYSIIKSMRELKKISMEYVS